MRILSRKTLRVFWEKHSDSELPLKVWYKRIEKSVWENLNQLKNEFPSVDFVGNDRYVFNVKGNNYRVVVKIDFKYRLILIRFVGTHAEYDKINTKTI